MSRKIRLVAVLSLCVVMFAAVQPACAGPFDVPTSGAGAIGYRNGEFYVKPSESGAVAGAKAGAAVGFYLGGPAGAAVGGAIGGIAGWILGPAD